MSKHLIRATAYVKVGGVIHDLGTFKTISGLSFTTSRRKSTRAAGEPEVARRGRKQVGDVTLGRENLGDLDLDWLRQVRGNEGGGTYQQLDDDKNPLGKPIAFTGRIADVNFPDGDAEATDEPADFSVVFTVNGD